MAQLWQDFQQVRLSVERMGDILNTGAEPGAGSRTALPALQGHIRFEAVRFRYAADGPWTLDDISLDLPAGAPPGIARASVSEPGRSASRARVFRSVFIPV